NQIDDKQHESKRSATTGSYFWICKQLLLLLLKLKSWRFAFLIIPIPLLMSNQHVLPFLTPHATSNAGADALNDRFLSYGAADFATSKAKVLAGRSDFSAETTAAASIVQMSGGSSTNWIEDCGSESECREQFIHRSDESVIALIRYSKTPETKRSVLECFKDEEQYKLASFSQWRNDFHLRIFINLRLFLQRHTKSSNSSAADKLPSTAKLNADLPQSTCAGWVKDGSLESLFQLGTGFTAGLSAIGMMFYLLSSTISCIRILKTGGFLQQLFRNGLSVSAYWLVIWLVTLTECLVFAGIYTASHTVQCPGVFSAAGMASIFGFFLLYCLYLAAFALLLELLLPSFILVVSSTMAVSIVCIAAFSNLFGKHWDRYATPVSILFSAEFISGKFSLDEERLWTGKRHSKVNPSRLSQILVANLIGFFVLMLLKFYLDFLVRTGNGFCLSLSYPVRASFWRPQVATSAAIEDTKSNDAKKIRTQYRAGGQQDVQQRLLFRENEVARVEAAVMHHLPRPDHGSHRTQRRWQVDAHQILTGEELPDEGTAHIGGCLVTNSLLRLSLRGRISTCPQFDALCDSLTVMECIRVTLVSRAASDTSQLERARGMLQRLGLGDKEDVLSCDLSGGQKRKVSTILALLGDPDVVFLDEPTSGLDPVSRRQLWAAAAGGEERPLHHPFMDEADILADRKIFLCGGKIVCAGSSMFLKRAFGCSFTLNVSLKSKSGAESLLAKLKQVRLKSREETELQLEVPALNSSVLTEAVQVLETSSEVETFGLSQASLDDVFMKLGGMDSEEIIKAFQSDTLTRSLPSERALFYFGFTELATACVFDLNQTDIAGGSDICRALALGGDAQKKKPIVLVKPESQSLNDFMAQSSTTEALRAGMKRNNWLDSKSMIPCVIYYASSWLLNATGSNRSISIASYLTDPIEDISSRVRAYLLSTGMGRFSYWINTFALHWLQYATFFSAAFGLLMLSAAHRSAYLILGGFLPALIFGITSNLLTIYTIALISKRKSMVVTVCCNAVFISLVMVSYAVRNVTALRVMISILPPLTPLRLMCCCVEYVVYKAQYYKKKDASALPGLVRNIWKYSDVFYSTLALPLHIILLCCAICMLENQTVTIENIRNFFCKKSLTKRPVKADSDIEEGAKKEAERVLAAPRGSKNVLEVRQLQKIYPNGVHAVRGVTFGAMAGEIFGLLGANGAGKSTSMSVIVGEEVATEGACEVHVQDGAWLSGREGATVGAIGYCPQHKPLFNCITVAEHIRFYADIRGLDSIEAERQTIRLMQSLGLSQHSDKQAGQLSGGNKRRLCLAIALLGDPALIVIDEASTGVDPENKRFIWGAIRRMVHKQRSVMVTTHSMEEVEALCSRVGIMNKGRMISVGTVQQLRSRHGDAYTLELLLAPETESVVRQKKLVIKKAVSEQFKGAQTQEDLGLGLVMQFSVPKSAVRSLCRVR
uniref:ABC transporter domain-containing protein n=1 Tax=Macrostomum lignano TaxID=282301 RepID=A0A1I8IQ13_9PLAT